METNANALLRSARRAIGEACEALRFAEAQLDASGQFDLGRLNRLMADLNDLCSEIREARDA